jgi:hypothetical protein
MTIEENKSHLQIANAECSCKLFKPIHYAGIPITQQIIDEIDRAVGKHERRFPLHQLKVEIYQSAPEVEPEVA